MAKERKIEIFTEVTLDLVCSCWTKKNPGISIFASERLEFFCS